jgi:metallo-beta-lactamase family protein
VYCTPATADLLGVMLRDSARLQEEDAERANRYGYTKHKPALPLYDSVDAERALERLEPRTYGSEFRVVDGVRAKLRRAGHILGAATIELLVGKKSPLRLVYSGDLGRRGRPILRDPERIPQADVLLVESTYGDRTHPGDAEERLVEIVNRVAERAGVLLVPSFAVGRTQELMWLLHGLEGAGRIPALPTFIDSPMAIDVTEIYTQHPEDHDLEMRALSDQRRSPLASRKFRLLRRADESKELNQRDGPMIVIAGSGMATGGRILHHLKQRLPDRRTTVLLPGFQAAGTRGRALQEGAQELRIHGAMVPVGARIETLDGLSAHADRNEILEWLRGFERPPDRSYVVHGEPAAADALAKALTGELGWRAEVARDAQTIEL